MYGIHRHMRRTQLYLDDEMSRFLTAESRRRGTTLSALVREAVAAAYGRAESADRGAIIRRLAGVWADREDIGPTASFVRELRRSTRPERWSRGRSGEVSPRQRRHH
jgi:Ribbon-helix-helix protein, copG family